MYMNGAGIGMARIITLPVHRGIPKARLGAPTGCNGAAHGTTLQPACVALVATSTAPAAGTTA